MESSKLESAGLDFMILLIFFVVPIVLFDHVHHYFSYNNLIAYYSMVFSEEDIRDATDMAGVSLMHTPSYVSMYHGIGGDHDRVAELKWLLFRNCLIMAGRNNNYLKMFYSEEKELECFFMMILSTHSSTTLWEKIEAGLLLLPFRVGLPIFQRIMSVSDWFDLQEEELMAGRTYYKLSNMVVRERLQGKGVGSRCLQLALAEADNEGLPVHLATQLEKNVVFYKRLGFEVVRETVYAEEEESPISFRSWFMVREPPKCSSTVHEFQISSSSDE